MEDKNPTDITYPTSTSRTDLGSFFGFLVLRIWLGVRSLVTGIEKFAGTKASATPVEIAGEANEYGLTEDTAEKVYGLNQYQGVPESLYTKFLAEPLIPEFALKIYNVVLGPALILLGITMLIGLAPRITLLAMGLLYTSLTVGLILLKQDAGIAWLAAHIILIAMALFTVRHNRFGMRNDW